MMSVVISMINFALIICRDGATGVYDGGHYSHIAIDTFNTIITVIKNH